MMQNRSCWCYCCFVCCCSSSTLLSFSMLCCVVCLKRLTTLDISALIKVKSFLRWSIWCFSILRKKVIVDLQFPWIFYFPSSCVPSGVFNQCNFSHIIFFLWICSFFEFSNFWSYLFCADLWNIPFSRMLNRSPLMWFLIVSLAFESQYAMGGKLIVSFSLCLMKK